MWKARYSRGLACGEFVCEGFLFTFSFILKCSPPPPRGGRKMTRRSCVVTAAGIAAGLLLGVGIGLAVSHVFRTLMHNRLKKVIQMTFDFSGLLLKGRVLELFCLCVPLSQSLSLICKARADVNFVTWCAHAQRFIHCLYSKPHS